MRRGPRREEPALLGHPDRVAPSEMPSFRSMDRTWLVAVLTATVSSSAISPPLSRVGGARARRASARSTVPESPSARCGARRRAAARTVCRPLPATEERRSSPVKPTAGARDERRRTNDADGLAKSERSAIAARPAFGSSACNAVSAWTRCTSTWVRESAPRPSGSPESPVVGGDRSRG